VTKHGLFVGLVTLDFVYLAKSLPERNQKVVALDYIAAAGGPATNAAVTFSYLGNSANLMGLVGTHPISQLVLAELQQWGLIIADLNPTHTEALPTSSIIVTQSTGERAVISVNATYSQVSTSCVPTDALQEIDIVLIDGHQMAVGQEIARQAKAQRISVVIDGGSWKPGFEHLLPHADYAICSENFYPPGCQSTAEVFDYLHAMKIPHIAVTRGGESIQFCSEGVLGKIPVPSIQPVDTLGAGDVFHGAFCHYSLQTNFQDALAQAAAIASRSCQFFGTRRWMQA
jgi:sugar/nucleoside kinase (ribokinase family)